MVDNLTDIMQREWSLVKSDANESSRNGQSWHSRFLSRKISDNTNGHNQHQNSHHPSTSDYSERSTLAAARFSKPLSNHKSSDVAYDTDGGIGTSGNMLKHRISSNNYEFLVSPKLPTREATAQSSRQAAVVPLQHRLSHKPHLTANPSLDIAQNHNDRDEEQTADNVTRRPHLRLSHRARPPPTPTANQGARVARSSGALQHGGPLAAIPSVQPLRIIFMRHSERANQALGSDWFLKAFRSKTYKAYDPNLPSILPKRRFDQAYQFDAPLTVRGLKTARMTGHAMMNNNLVVDICLSSTALRCVQTCERILSGMDRRDQIPIRIEPGLFECPHFNHKIVESFMTKTELAENRYNIKQEYKPLVPKVTVPEALDGYFERSAAVMRGILDRYGPYGGTVLIVTHAPGLLALTDAIKGSRPNIETFYRTVSMYPPLAMYIADYDGSKWRYSNQPFNIVPTEQ